MLKLSKDFLNQLKNATKYKRTENLALTLDSSQDALVDFFSLGAALRTRENQEMISLFTRAFSKDPLLALKCLFYIRDIRGGQGERKTFRTILNYLGDAHKEIIFKNLPNIPEYGRWDDLFVLLDTNSEGEMMGFLRDQLLKDLESNNPSLLGKWMKSENTSSKQSKEIARKVRKKLEISHKDYRVMLSKLRKKIKIVESQMCAQKWKTINYEAIPSRAAMIYRKAFKKHDQERYEQYLQSVKKGEKTIKTQALYPYDLMRIVSHGEYNETIELQWKNLPDYTKGTYENSIVVCDTSGSMNGLPLQVAISLSIYLAERIQGPFKDHFITFSERPKLQEIQGKTLHEKYWNLSRAHWDSNTNLQLVFDLILSVARASNISEDEMIKKIYIISDMEFDAACGYVSYWGSGRPNEKTNFETIQDKYAKAGFQMPQLIFWNVQSRQDQSPVEFNQEGAMLVSGCSPSIFESIMSGEIITPLDLVLKKLNSDRYDRIKL